jgi:hypothetical protein
MHRSEEKYMQGRWWNTYIKDRLEDLDIDERILVNWIKVMDAM